MFAHPPRASGHLPRVAPFNYLSDKISDTFDLIPFSNRASSTTINIFATFEIFSVKLGTISVVRFESPITFRFKLTFFFTSL